MKKLYLIAPALTLLAITGTANAVLVAGDDPSYTKGTGETSAQLHAASTSSLSGDISTPDAPGGSGTIPVDENVDNQKYGALPARKQLNSHMDLWMLLLVAAVAGIVSEVLHRRTSNR